MTDIRERLAELDRVEAEVRDDRGKVYREMAEADPEDLAASQLGRMFSEPDPWIKFPIEVAGIGFDPDSPMFHKWRPSTRRPHPWVSIYPCGAGYEREPRVDCESCDGTGCNAKGKPCGCTTTYLGIHVGDIARGCSVRFKDGALLFRPNCTNPAIWIPDRNELLFGAESFWGPVNDPKKLRLITREDCNNVFYVRALKEIGGQK